MTSPLVQKDASVGRSPKAGKLKIGFTGGKGERERPIVSNVKRIKVSVRMMNVERMCV